MKFSKKLWRSGLLLAAAFIAAAVGLRLGYTNFEKSVYPLRYSNYVEKYAEEYQLEPALVYAVIRSESNFDENAKSHAGAVGLMQLMPETFLWLQESQDEHYSEDALLLPEVNIRYGCRYLAMMVERYGVLRTAICAYNAGSGTVDGWLNDRKLSSDGKNLGTIPYRETQNYADAVLQSYQKYKKLYQM